jgi:hypothetical protein
VTGLRLTRRGERVLTVLAAVLFLGVPAVLVPAIDNLTWS